MAGILEHIFRAVSSMILLAIAWCAWMTAIGCALIAKDPIMRDKYYSTLKKWFPYGDS